MSARHSGASLCTGGIVETPNCWSSGLGWRLSIIRTSSLLHTWAPGGPERLVGDLPEVISWQRQGTNSKSVLGIQDQKHLPYLQPLISYFFYFPDEKEVGLLDNMIITGILVCES